MSANSYETTLREGSQNDSIKDEVSFREPSMQIPVAETESLRSSDQLQRRRASAQHQQSRPTEEMQDLRLSDERHRYSLQDYSTSSDQLQQQRAPEQDPQGIPTEEIPYLRSPNQRLRYSLQDYGSYSDQLQQHRESEQGQQGMQYLRSPDQRHRYSLQDHVQQYISTEQQNLPRVQSYQSLATFPQQPEHLLQPRSEQREQQASSRDESHQSLASSPQQHRPLETQPSEYSFQEQQTNRQSSGLASSQQDQERQQSQNAIPSEQPQQPHQALANPLDQQPAPTVLVVQQPIILGRGASIRRGHPFMHRGIQLSNGRKIGLNCMISFAVFGLLFITLGLMYGIGSSKGFLCIVIGGIQLGACIRLCYKAKQDFDALPQDHPDRVIYSAPIHLSREAREIASNATTYQLPPGTQIISSSTLSGQGTPAYQFPVGTQVLNSTSTLNGRLAPSAFLQQAFGSSSSGRSTGQEDKPPSYDEVCKQMRH